MDFHSMKRKQLQALCKKHKIPANLSNLELANRLTEFLKERENPVIKEQEENVSEIESNDEVLNKKGKKVRFSPEHELIEFTRSLAIKRRSRRNFVYSSESDSNRSVEIVESGERNKQTVGSAIGTGESNLIEAAEVKQNKRGVKAVKGDEKSSDNLKNEEIVNNDCRVTRSRAKKLTEAPAVEEKRGRKVVKNTGKVAVVRAETDDGRGGTSTVSSSKSGDDGGEKPALGKGLKENKQSEGERLTIKPQLPLRRSKRKSNMDDESENDAEISAMEVNPSKRAVLKVEETTQNMEPRRRNRRKTMIGSAIFTNDARIHEKDEVESPRKTSKMLASDGSQQVNPSINAVLKIEEPIQKVEPRRSNRRKTMVESGDLRGETNNRFPLKSSLPQSDIVPEVSKESKLVIQPIDAMRRSRRKTLCLKLVSANDTDSTVGCLEAEKHTSKPCLVEKENGTVGENTRPRRKTSKGKPKVGGDPSIQVNKVMKRKRGHVSGGENNNNLNSGEQSLKGCSSKKVVFAAATQIFADERDRPHTLDHPNSPHRSSGTGESLFVDVQPSISKDSKSASNLCSRNITDVELRESHKKKEEVSIADSAESSSMNLTNGEDLVNSDTNAASKTTEKGTNSSVTGDQNFTSKVAEVESSKFDAMESIEQNITDVNKNDNEAQVYSQMEDSGCNNKINDQELEEGLNGSGEERSAETCSSGGSFLLGDQTDVETDLKVAEAEVDELVQPCLRVVDHHNNLESSINVIDHKNEDTSQTFGEDGASESCGMTRHHVDNVDEADEDGCLKDHRDASDHFSVFDMPDRGISADSTDVNLKRLHERYMHGVAETCESDLSKGLKRKCDEDGEFSLTELFDEDGRYGFTPQEKENLSGGHPVKDFNKQGKAHGSPSILTTMLNSAEDHEANLSPSGERGETYNFKNKQSKLTEAYESGSLKKKSSISQETNPSTPSSVSETQEKQKSLLAKCNALASSNQRQGAWSITTELAENAVWFLKSSEENITQVPEDDKEASAKATISDVQSCLISKIAAESLGDMKSQDSVENAHPHKNLLARQTNAGDEAIHATSRQSWTETELHNLFGTSSEDDHPGMGDTFYQGSVTANVTSSKNKLTASDRVSLTKKQDREMDADIYENEFKVLFATPIKMMTPCKIEEAYSHDRELDGSVTSIKGCSNAMKENVDIESRSCEKSQCAGFEVENNSSSGASLSNNGGDDICQEINMVESFELLNASTRVLSEAEYEDQLNQNKEEFLQENNLITEEDREEHVIPHMLEDGSCKGKAYNKSEGEWTQSNKVELSDGDIKKSDVLENGHLLTGCSLDSNNLRETSVEISSDPEVAEIGSSDKDAADDAADKGISPLLILKASLDCEDLVLESDDQYEAKKLDEEDGNPKSSQAISDELHTNSEMAIQESVSIGFNKCQELDQLPSSDELGSTCEEAKEMETTTQILHSTDAASEHGSFVRGAVSGVLSSSAMHNSLGYHENGDKKSEDGEPVFDSDHGKVQDAAFELGNSLWIGHLLSDVGGEDNCGKMNDVESKALNCTATTVLSETGFHGCDASQLTEITGECQRETNFMTEDNEERIVPQSCLFDEELDNDSESTEENSFSATQNNLDKPEGCQDMLIDSTMAESPSCKTSVDHKSEQETIQSEAGLTCCLEHESTFVETKETGATSQDLNNIVAPTDYDSSVRSADSRVLSSSEMHLHLRNENSSIKNLDVGKPVLSLSVDNDKMDNEKAEEITTAEMVQFTIQELHSEEKKEHFTDDTPTISNQPASGYNGILKESNVADTINEYIDSESSMSVMFENSSASNPRTAMSANSKHEDNASSVDGLDTEIQELQELEQATLLTRPAGFLDQGSTAKLETQKKMESEEGQNSSSTELHSTMKSNATTILIHGTPGKLLSMADMKENTATLKRSNIGDVTAVRPAKRKALQDLQWK